MRDASDRASSETAPATAAAARHIVRGAMKASLATLEAPSGAPYASLVTVATLPSAAPVLAISSLSHHHGNITADGRVSLLFDGTPSKGDPLAAGRVTVSGRAVPARCEIAEARFKARHPGAFYTDFGDFGFFTVEVERAHFVAGFGRVRWFDADAFLVADDLGEAEAGIVEHMNADHAGAVAAYASGLLGAAPGPWRMCGVDIEGADLEWDGVALRLDFPEAARTSGDVRRHLVNFAGEARAAKDLSGGS